MNLQLANKCTAYIESRGVADEGIRHIKEVEENGTVIHLISGGGESVRAKSEAS